MRWRKLRTVITQTIGLPGQSSIQFEISNAANEAIVEAYFRENAEPVLVLCTCISRKRLNTSKGGDSQVIMRSAVFSARFTKACPQFGSVSGRQLQKLQSLRALLSTPGPRRFARLPPRYRSCSSTSKFGICSRPTQRCRFEVRVSQWVLMRALSAGASEQYGV